MVETSGDPSFNRISRGIINYFFKQTVHHLKINYHILPSSSLATVRCWWYRAWRAESGLTSWVKWWFGRWWCGWCWGCRGSALTLGRVVWETGLGSIQPGVKDWTGWEIHPPKSSLWKLWKNLGHLTNIEMDRNKVCQNSSAPEIGIKVLLTGLHPSVGLW